MGSHAGDPGSIPDRATIFDRFICDLCYFFIQIFTIYSSFMFFIVLRRFEFESFQNQFVLKLRELVKIYLNFNQNKTTADLSCLISATVSNYSTVAPVRASDSKSLDSPFESQRMLFWFLVFLKTFRAFSKTDIFTSQPWYTICISCYNQYYNQR